MLRSGMIQGETDNAFVRQDLPGGRNGTTCLFRSRACGYDLTQALAGSCRYRQSGSVSGWEQGCVPYRAGIGGEEHLRYDLVRAGTGRRFEIGRAPICTPVIKANLVVRLL